MPRRSAVLRAAMLAPLLVVTAGSHGLAEGPAAPMPSELRVVRSYKIWDAAPHNAFSDLVRWRGRFYCSFREGTAHGSYDGAARILVSDDGEDWEPLVRFADEGLDLRDPKLCALPDGRLLLSAAAEDTPNAVDDGPVVAAALVLVDGEDVLDVAAVPEVDGRVPKVEGLAVRSVRDGAAHLLAVVDDDDPTRPSTALELHVDLG